MTHRQEAAQQTRRKLLEAGRKLVGEKGLSGISVEDITAASGVSKGTFYTYFKSKEEIVLALSADMFGEVLTEAKEFPGDFEQKLSHYMLSFSGWIERGSIGLAQEWIRSVVDPSRPDGSKLRSDLADMEELFAFGKERGLIAEYSPGLPRTLVEILYGELLCWCMQGGSFLARTQAFCEGELHALLQDNIK